MNDSLPEALRRAADDTELTFDTTGHDLLRRARRRARNRLLATTAAAVILVVAAAGAATAVLPGLLTAQAPVAERPPAVRVPTVQPPGSARILTNCSSLVPRPLKADFGGPGARVITADVTKRGTSAFILSKDRQTIVECAFGPGSRPVPVPVPGLPGAPVPGLPNPSPSGSPLFRVYDVHAAPSGSGQNRPYRTHQWFSYCDRFPAKVARVRLDLDGGGHVSARAIDGFVAFYEPLPRSSTGPTHITLYDQHGVVLASADWGELPSEYDSLLPAVGGASSDG